MPATIVKVPAKTILFGEHAVVYGQPAIAIPVHQLETTVTIHPHLTAKQEQIIFDVPDINLLSEISEIPKNHPFYIAVLQVKDHLGLTFYPSCKVSIHSTIPIGSGLGSSAALSVALIRALTQFVGAILPDKQISELAYQIEVTYHGTPSGIDNAVITYKVPIIFQKNKEIKLIKPQKKITIVVANSGIMGKTREAVAGVRKRWIENPEIYEKYFNNIGDIVKQAIPSLEKGELEQLGMLMSRNHQLLINLGVSHPVIDNLVNKAIQSGASGAKLCGGGLGGNMIAISDESNAQHIAQTLQEEGAVNTIITTLGD